MNYIIIISVAAYLVMSLMAFQIIEACKHETQEISKRYIYREKYSAL
ncbi:hypothetical protein GXM_07972 [Nostoc sphaeroides CCNUC1]|uniref:Uncharacterized protein n=1 Tax=Nostoc sphaeroides CCNUC1 TaxID=2653204 RepID=A0A5P8WCL1_9NOSO|nr:hypothetical protein GXM_07972 [Nostoc sphaeroides CCNUC1]